MTKIYTQCAVDIIRDEALKTVSEINRVPLHYLVEDQGLAYSYFLATVFDGHGALRPWLLQRDVGGVVTVIGHGDINNLNSALDRSRSKLANCVTGLRSLPPITIETGKRYRFEVRVCPTVNATPRGNDKGGEMDVFLAEERKGTIPVGEKRHDGVARRETYRAWLQRKLPGATIDDFYYNHRENWRIGSFYRRSGQSWKLNRWPVAHMEGKLTVHDENTFFHAISQGVGRQSAYGFGAIRLDLIEDKERSWTGRFGAACSADHVLRLRRSRASQELGYPGDHGQLPTSASRTMAPQ